MHTCLKCGNAFEGNFCPECGAPMFKKAGRQGMIYCAKENCGYKRPLDTKESKTDES